MIRMYWNAAVTHRLQGEEPTRARLDFHRRLPGYAPTLIVSVPELARKLNLGRVWVKDESNR